MVRNFDITFRRFFGPWFDPSQWHFFKIYLGSIKFEIEFFPGTQNRASGRRTAFFLAFPFSPSFPLCPLFFHFGVHFWVLGHFFQRFVGSPWPHRTDGGRATRARGARAHTREPPPASARSILAGVQICHFLARSLSGLCHFGGPILGNVFLSHVSHSDTLCLSLIAQA